MQNETARNWESKMRIKTKPVKYVSWELAKPGKYHYNPQRTIEDFIEW